MMLVDGYPLNGPARQVRLPEHVLEPIFASSPIARAYVFPVIVDWPELALTPYERDANLRALMRDEQAPYLNHQHFTVELEVPHSLVQLWRRAGGL